MPLGTVLGNPGILVDELLPERPPKRRRAVIVPHYDVRTLLADIASAEVIYTSSLHGLIAADALGVPQVFEPRERVPGGQFKFQDYASAFGETMTPGVRRLTDRSAMAERQHELRTIFRTLRELFPGSNGAPDGERCPPDASDEEIVSVRPRAS